MFHSKDPLDLDTKSNKSNSNGEHLLLFTTI